MTSTNFQVGFADNAKNASKVLKPPGGGTSDIFGGESSMETPRTVKNRMASNIFGETGSSVSKNVQQGIYRYFFLGERPRAVVNSHNRLFGEPDRIQTPLKNRMKSNIPIGDTVDKGINGHANGHSAGTPSPKINGHSVNGGGSSKMMENGVEHINGTKAGTFLRRRKPDDSPFLVSSRSTASNASSPMSSMSTRSGNSSASAKQLFGNDCCAMNGGFNRPKYSPRNPVTGLGLNEPMNRVRKLGSNRREGNPVTGEGYKPAGTEINTSIPSLNGANQVIIKNRIPPGGFSSGLW
ncbi:microtubule-associated protein Jupiter isoform X2 [Phlebotomus argentipes]|uniref:microtubule-associated protein Jupiter isoform X2 n=1 Tax=Phlebotomus argentipes TaxID=94469 RepID=UPI002892C6C3|nr:microtubule-associated protein Jupiter isoform X2 [Phlebotomus argentipes]